jgi:hypothetical protein
MTALGRKRQEKMKFAIVAIALCVTPLAFADGISTKEDKDSCEKLDLRAIHLSGQRRLQEAAKLMDYTIERCAPDASRLTSRGVLYAVMGDKGSAERLISEAIRFSEGRGDKCQADLSRAELAAIKGQPVPSRPPLSCSQKRNGL